MPPQLWPAFDYFNRVVAEIQADNPDLTREQVLAKITITGHSLGAYLGTVVGAVNGVNTVVFDALPAKTTIDLVVDQIQQNGGLPPLNGDTEPAWSQPEELLALARNAGIALGLSPIGVGTMLTVGSVYAAVVANGIPVSDLLQTLFNQSSAAVVNTLKVGQTYPAVTIDLNATSASSGNTVTNVYLQGDMAHNMFPVNSGQWVGQQIAVETGITLGRDAGDVGPDWMLSLSALTRATDSRFAHSIDLMNLIIDGNGGATSGIMSDALGDLKYAVGALRSTTLIGTDTSYTTPSFLNNLNNQHSNTNGVSAIDMLADDFKDIADAVAPGLGGSESGKGTERGRTSQDAVGELEATLTRAVVLNAHHAVTPGMGGNHLSSGGIVTKNSSELTADLSEFGTGDMTNIMRGLDLNGVIFNQVVPGDTAGIADAEGLKTLIDLENTHHVPTHQLRLQADKILGLTAVFNGQDQNTTGKGADLVIGGRGSETLRGGEGDDTLYGGNDGNDVLIGGAGSDLLIGSTRDSRNITADYSGQKEGITQHLAQERGVSYMVDLTGTDTVVGVSTLIATDAKDVLYAANGDFQTIKAGGGDDHVMFVGQNPGIGSQTVVPVQADGGDGRDLLIVHQDMALSSYIDLSGKTTSVMYTNTGFQGTAVFNNIKDVVGSCDNDHMRGTSGNNIFGRYRLNSANHKGLSLRQFHGRLPAFG